MTDKQQIIIFDGPDMCGKTNIAHALSKAIRVPYFKNTRESGEFVDGDTDYFVNASKYIDTYMPNFLRATGVSVIFDRNYPSEFVYPVIFNRRRDIDILRKIDDMHASLGTKIIVPYRSSYEGVHDDTHAWITPDVLIDIDEMYDRFCKWSNCRSLLINVDDEDIDRELSEIIAFIES